MKHIVRRYWSKRGRTYDNAPGHSGFKHVWGQLLRLTIGELPRSKAIDYGCGTGFLTGILASMGMYVLCLDIAEGMLREAKRKLGENLLVDFVQGDCEKPPIRAGSMNIAVSRHVLWTLEKPHLAVLRWSNTLRKGGILVIFDGVWEIEHSTARRILKSLLQSLKMITKGVDPITSLRYNMSRIKRIPDHITLVTRVLEKTKVSFKVIDMSIIRRLMSSEVRRSTGGVKYYIIMVTRE